MIDAFDVNFLGVEYVRVYLDNCCFYRPYDDQSQLSISLDIQAKIHIQDEIRTGKLEMATSFMLNFENAANPNDNRKLSIGHFMEEYSAVYIDQSFMEQLNPTIQSIMGTGIKVKDATHVACAIRAGCDFLVTTDKRLLKYKTDRLELVTPSEFINRMEDQT